LLHPTALLVVAALVVGRLRTPALAALAVCLAATVGSLGLEKVWDGRPSVFFPHERAYLALPYVGTWLLWLALADLRWIPRATRTVSAAASVAVLLLVTGLVARETRRPDFIRTEVELSGNSAVRPREVTHVMGICSSTDVEARRKGAQWVVFSDDRTAAYACGALWYGQRNTIFPYYERRHWLLTQLTTDYKPAEALWYPPLP
jgi:hypothetical protein